MRPLKKIEGERVHFKSIGIRIRVLDTFKDNYAYFENIETRMRTSGKFKSRY